MLIVRPFPKLSLLLYARAPITCPSFSLAYAFLSRSFWSSQCSPHYQGIWGKHIHHGLWRTGKETKEEASDNMVFE